MSDVSRKEFLKYSAAAATTAVAGAYVFSVFGGTIRGAGAGSAREAYDLLIKGGEVLDPGQGLRDTLDVAISNGRISAVEADISEDDAREVIQADGKLVVPGLIDMHAHVYPEASGLGLPADELVPQTATTTYVSAGDAGANNFSGLDHWVIGQSRSRIYAFLHVSTIGLAGYPVDEMLNMDYANVEFAAKTLAENEDVLLGMKVREGSAVVGDNGLEPLERAIEAAEMSGTGARVMCHIGNAPGDLSDLLEMLRPGDILPHAYSGAGNNVVQDDELLPAVLEAKERGVVIDVGHGGGSFDYTIAKPAIEAGLVPDTIGSDIHAESANTEGMSFLPWVMSKFLNLDFSLEEVVAMATTNPAEVIGRVEGLGTLQTDAPGDVSILELVEDSVTFVDTNGNERTGDRYLRPSQTIRAGRPFGVPYPQPFTFP